MVKYVRKNNINSKTKILGITLLVVFLISLLLSYWGNKKHVFRIEGTGKKQEASFGTDIRVAKIIRNNVVLSGKDVKLNGEWVENNGSFCAMQTDSSTWIEIPFYKTDDLRVEFVSQCGSGCTTIYLDGHFVEERDLYALEWINEEYVVNESIQPTRIQIIAPWLLLLEGLSLEYYLLTVLLSCLNIKWKTSCWNELNQ